MKKKKKSALSVGFISLGCAKNLVDSQIMAGTLLSKGIRIAPSPEEADVVLVNTCTFIAEAREESLASIVSACALKKEGPCRAVVVTGCMPQRYGKELTNYLPDVDAFAGLDRLDKIADICKNAARGKNGKKKIISISAKSSKLFEPVVPNIVFSGGPHAFLKIAEGCNHRCSFCVIPDIRGKYRSRGISKIVKEAQQLLEAGYRELVIIAQDTTFYGTDLPKKKDITDLLRALDKIGGDFWIRLLYCYPSRLTDKLLKAIAEIPRVCKYVDVPIQHSHPDILKAMKRTDTISHMKDLTKHIRKMIPGVTIRTTCLTGFPGEQQNHFENLLKFINEARFDHVGAFAFSPEEGTPAVNMPNRPLQSTAEKRRRQLLRLQREIVKKRSRDLVGRIVSVLLDRKLQDSNVWQGRSHRFAPEVDGHILVRNVPDHRKPGDFIKVRYTGQKDYDMLGTYVGS